MNVEAIRHVALELPVSVCTRTAYRVLLMAVLTCDDSPQRLAMVNRAWYARRLGLRRDTVGRAVRELVTAGLLEPVERPRLREDGTMTSTVYSVLPGGDADDGCASG